MKILHISIPKNGGTYIANALARNFRPQQQYVVDEARIKLTDFEGIVDEVTDKYDFVAGHIPFRVVADYAGKFDLIISSFRQPWSRCWSTFRYVTASQALWAHLQPTSDDEVPEFFSRFVDEYFIANRFTRNNQCGYLGSANLPRLAMSNIDRFSIRMLRFDRLEEDLRVLTRNRGLLFNENAPTNKSSGRVSIKQGEFPKIDRKILGWFDGDFLLYQALNKRLTKV